MQKLKAVLSKLVLFLGGAAVLGCLLFSQNIKDGYYRDSIGSNVVKIMNIKQTGAGTGFHVEAESGDIYILTNKHVCELADKQGNVLVVSDDKEMVRKVIKKYEHHDLCLVEKMPGVSDGLEIASSSNAGEDVIVVGHPGGRKLTLSHGEFIGLDIIMLPNFDIKTKEECNGQYIEDIMAIMILGHGVCLEEFVSHAISAPIYGGNSGSPVINKYGNVVGVVFAGNPRQNTDGFMVPLQYVQDFLGKF